jgi:hypothetical protein
MPLPPAEQVVRWADAERCRTALLALAAELAPHGIELLVIKGVYVAFVVADEPWMREMLDADAIVVRGSFADAVRVIRASPSFGITCDDWSTKAVVHRASGAMVDVHRLALPPGWGRVALSGLQARARKLPDVLGPHVLAPDPLDAAAFTVAHYVKDIVGRKGHGKAAMELDRLVARAGLAPAPLAARLRVLGLRRVGLVAFTAMADENARWRPFLDACAGSRIERRAARAAVSTLRALFDAGWPDAAFLVVRSIADRVVPDSAVGFALTAARLSRDRILARAHRAR